MNDKQAHSLAVAMTKAIMGKDYIDEGEVLRPCPFCGCRAEEISRQLILDTHLYSVKCTNPSCQCTLAWFTKREEVIQAWNSRYKT